MSNISVKPIKPIKFTKPINFILAISSDNVIGANSQIPWKIKEDLKYFKSFTSFDPNASHNKWLKENNIKIDPLFVQSSSVIRNMVIMGLKTFESIGSKPLPNRLNVVLTSKYEEMSNKDNLVFLSNISNALYYGNICPNIKTIWIIGGKQLFESINDIKPNNVYLTKINMTLSHMTNKIQLDNTFFEYLEQNYKVKSTDSDSDSASEDFFSVEAKQEVLPYYKTICKDLISNTDVEVEFITYNIKKTESTYDDLIDDICPAVIPEKQYLNLLKNVISYGEFRQTRNDFTWSDFGAQLEFDLIYGFPLLTSKKVPLRIIFEELMFFIRGYTDNKILKEKNIHIWDSNTTKSFIESNNKRYSDSDRLLETDDMGPMYGFQWRYFGSKYDRISNPLTAAHYKSATDLKHDQLLKVINELRTDPFSRRIIMTTFNPEQVSNGVLYPCHSIVIQFYAKTDPINSTNLLLSIKMYQRSADLFLGLPFNIASTALFLHLVCDHLNRLNQPNKSYTYVPSKVIISLGDTHIYQSHLDAVLTQLQANIYNFPILRIRQEVDKPITSIESYEWSNIELLDYKADKMIKAKMIA
jgi:dihydrofolate reductase/thymidylate synthase